MTHVTFLFFNVHARNLKNDSSFRNYLKFLFVITLKLKRSVSMFAYSRRDLVLFALYLLIFVIFLCSACFTFSTLLVYAEI